MFYVLVVGHIVCLWTLLWHCFMRPERDACRFEVSNFQRVIFFSKLSRVLCRWISSVDFFWVAMQSIWKTGKSREIWHWSGKCQAKWEKSVKLWFACVCCHCCDSHSINITRALWSNVDVCHRNCNSLKDINLCPVK